MVFSLYVEYYLYFIDPKCFRDPGTPKAKTQNTWKAERCVLLANYCGMWSQYSSGHLNVFKMWTLLSLPVLLWPTCQPISRCLHHPHAAMGSQDLGGLNGSTSVVSENSSPRSLSDRNCVCRQTRLPDHKSFVSCNNILGWNHGFVFFPLVDGNWCCINV